MRKLLRVTFGALLLLAIPLLAFAGAVGDWQMPHLTTIPLIRMGSAGPESLSFYLEGSGGAKAVGAAYDTVSTVDTLSWIPLNDNYSMLSGTNWINKSGTASIGDSLWLGRLTITFDDAATRLLGSADSVIVMTDISTDGPSGSHFMYQPALESDGKGGILRFSASQAGAYIVTKDLFSLGPLTKAAGIEANKTICDCFGASAIRFRLAMGITSAPIKVKSATWTYISSHPDFGK